MMLFQVTYTMLPGQRDAFLQMMRESGILDQIRREEGCLDYRYYLPEEEDGTLRSFDKKEVSCVHAIEDWDDGIEDDDGLDDDGNSLEI